MSRVVVVSGGGTGIGRAIAAVFAAEGDRVGLIGRRADMLERTLHELGAGATAFPADLRDASEVERVVSELVHTLEAPSTSS